MHQLINQCNSESCTFAGNTFASLEAGDCASNLQHQMMRNIFPSISMSFYLFGRPSSTILRSV